MQTDTATADLKCSTDKINAAFQMLLLPQQMGDLLCCVNSETVISKRVPHCALFSVWCQRVSALVRGMRMPE